jgi:hypothetical protein
MDLTLYILYLFVGWLEDLTGNWNMSFRFLGLLSTISFVLCLSIPLVERWWCYYKETKSDHLKDKQTNLEEINANIRGMEKKTLSASKREVYHWQ